MKFERQCAATAQTRVVFVVVCCDGESTCLTCTLEVAVKCADGDATCLQAKNENQTTGQGRWPKKSAEFLLGLLKNAESNAEVGHYTCRLALDFSRCSHGAWCHYGRC